MNPFRRGMVRVLFTEDVPEGEEVDEKEEDEFGKVTYIANPENIPEGERPAKAPCCLMMSIFLTYWCITIAGD